MLKRFCSFVFLLALFCSVIHQVSFGQSQDRGLVIPVGTEIQLTLRDPVSSKLSEPGDEVLATVRRSTEPRELPPAPVATRRADVPCRHGAEARAGSEARQRPIARR